MSIGLKDSTCPPETIRPVFDKIKTKKMLVVYPDLTHMRCQDFRLAELAWLRQTLCA
jgi:cephalosporin-C deacetylase-like acetyl esterase